MLQHVHDPPRCIGQILLGRVGENSSWFSEPFGSSLPLFNEAHADAWPRLSLRLRREGAVNQGGGTPSPVLELGKALNGALPDVAKPTRKCRSAHGFSRCLRGYGYDYG